MSLAMILVVIAFIFFLLAACNVPLGRINLVAAGLAILTLVYAIGLYPIRL